MQQGVNGGPQRAQDGRWSLFEMSTAHAAEAMERTRWAVVPTGSIEQHGPHLPLGTDAMGAIAVARRVSEKIPVIVAPPVVYGYSPYHMSWKGTITLRSSVYHGLLMDIGTSLARHGIEAITFINGHGGNRPLIDVAASDLQFEADVRTYVINFPYLGAGLLGDRLDLAHAGRFETAAVRAFDASLIDLERATDPSEPATLRAQARYRSIAAYPLRRDFREIQPTGWGGNPHDATDEDAEDLVETVAEEVVSILKGEFGAPERAPAPSSADL